MSQQEQQVNALSVLRSTREKADRIGIDALSRAERTFLLPIEFLTALDMQGISGFYEWVVGSHAAETVEALRAIGAHRTAEILLELNQAFPGGAPSGDHERRIEQLDELRSQPDDPLDRHERRLRDAVAELGGLPERYLLANKDEFPPVV